MKETVDSGTGTKAKMKDYTAGGKTGTAQIYDYTKGRYMSGESDYIYSFSGSTWFVSDCAFFGFSSVFVCIV